MSRLFTLIAALLFFVSTEAQTSWKGTSSTAWNNSANWTNGVPGSTVDAIIGDASFTGPNQPTISAIASAKSLTLGGTTAATLTVNKGFTVAGNIQINSNGTLTHNGVSISLSGNWTNSGTYTASANKSKVIFAGTGQTITGTSSFRRLTVNTGSTVTLASNITVSGTQTQFVVNGTLNPSTYTISSTNLTLAANAKLFVYNSTFASNYNVSGTVTLNSGSIVEYASSSVAQTINNSYTYSTLIISGSTTKSLAGNLPALRSATTAEGNIYVNGGTFDLSSFTANRGATVSGGVFSIAAGATLKIGGTNSFPSNFSSRTLNLSSTVEYSGTNQTVTALSYGNLSFSSSSGAAVKTMPVTPLTINGNFSSSIGSGTSVTFTAAEAITVSGNMSLGASTIFNGAGFSHIMSGNWTNTSGTYNGNTGTVTFNGPASLISGSGTNNFNNLIIAASSVTASGNINVSGDFSTSGPGSFTQGSTATFTMSGSGKTVSGTGISFGNLTISGSISSAASFSISGNLSNSGSLSLSAGTISMNGASKSISGAGTYSFSSLSISGSVSTSSNFSIASALNVSGTFSASAGTATFTGSSTLNGTANLYNVTLNGTSLQLSTNANLGIANVLAISAGTLNVSSSTPNTVSFNGTGAQNVNGISYNNLSFMNGGTKTASAAITVNGDLSIGTSTTFAASGFTHNILGNWNNNGTFTAGTSTITFSGAANASISGATSFNILTINKSATSNVLNLGSNVSTPTLNMTSGELHTGSNSITITSARNGNGIILGTITRTHSFSAGTSYNFESAYNSLNISGANTLSSVTMTVSQGNISDFPFGGSINRVYNISYSGSLAASTATLRLHYEDNELNGNSESTMQLWKYSGSWANSGKSSNSSTNNYIEQNALTDLSGRWTISDNNNVVRWNGSTSSDWSIASNWTVVQGSASTPPASTDIVQLGSSTFTNQPAINSAVTVKSIVFGSSQAVSLSMNPGSSLNVNGNINGSWSANATHSINAAAQTIAVSGDMTLSDGTNGHDINLLIGTGTVTVSGSLSQLGSAAITFNSNGTLNIGNDFNYSAGTFTCGTGTVNYNGTGAQSVAQVVYYNMSINKGSGIATASSSLDVNNQLNITAGSLYLQSSSSIGSHVTISSGATLNAGSNTMNVAGNWVNNGSFVASTSTVNLNGLVAQSITSTTFNNLALHKANTATLNGNISINGDLIINSGILDIGSYTANRALLGGTMTLSGGTSLSLAASNFPQNFSVYSMANNSTVHYNGTGTQSVTGGISYGNLSFSNGSSNAKTLAASTSVTGNLSINSGASFAASSFTLTLDGNWTNNGTFTPGTSTVILNGSNGTVNGTTTFNRLTVIGSYTVNNSDITLNGLINITSTGSYAAGSGIHTVNGDLTNSGSLSSTGTTTFSGTSAQTIRLLNAISSNSSGIVNFNGSIAPTLNSTSAPTFANLNINNTAGITPSVGWTIVTSMTVANGSSFIGGSYTHNIYGNFTNNGTVTSSGTLNFSSGSATAINFAGTNFSSSGIVQFNGSGEVTLSGTPTALQNVYIANTNAAGITAPSGWSMGGNFSIASNSTFNAGAHSYTVAGNIVSNGTLNGGTSTFTMTSSAGEISGSSTTTFNHLTISGSVISNSDFNVAGNFTNNGTYDGSQGAMSMTGGNNASISGTTTPSTIAQLIVNKTVGKSVSLAVNISAVADLYILSGTLNASSFSISQDVGSLGIEDNGTLQIAGTNTIPTFTVYSLDTLSTVEYNGGAQSISNSVNYGNLVISASGNKTASGALTVLNNFSLSAGTFIGGNNTHSVAANWNMSGGSFTNTNTTILLNGTAAQSVSSTGSFNNLTVNKTAGLVSALSNLNVNGTLTLSSGKFSIGANNLNAAIISGASSSSYVIAEGSGTLVQYVANGSSKQFPVGLTAAYMPATVALTAGSTADSIRVRLMDKVYNAGTSGGEKTSGVVDASWFISEKTVGGSSASITLQWPGIMELAGFDRSMAMFGHYRSSDWYYGNLTPASGSNPYTLSQSSITDLSIFAVGTQGALPVTWLNVRGEHKNGSNLIYWSTASEWNNDYFEVEVSTDAVNFQVIGTVKGAGNSSVVNKYQFTHSDPKQVSYYRIRQVDFDGKSEYSQTIVIKYSKNNVAVYPNPASSYIKFDVAEGESFVITDANGRLISEGTYSSSVQTLSVEHLSPGVYFLVIKTGTESRNSVFIKQ